ncbi:hypothetical protein E2542_SST25595 [Spatholobus suberectus]|nr:hypothetical protein E2542_SST25595 [Spatholobus suberectus]
MTFFLSDEKFVRCFGDAVVVATNVDTFIHDLLHELDAVCTKVDATVMATKDDTAPSSTSSTSVAARRTAPSSSQCLHLLKRFCLPPPTQRIGFALLFDVVMISCLFFWFLPALRFSRRGTNARCRRWRFAWMMQWRWAVDPPFLLQRDGVIEGSGGGAAALRYEYCYLIKGIYVNSYLKRRFLDNKKSI